jgi:hypothetical protein
MHFGETKPEYLRRVMCIPRRNRIYLDIGVDLSLDWVIARQINWFWVRYSLRMNREDRSMEIDVILEHNYLKRIPSNCFWETAKKWPNQYRKATASKSSFWIDNTIRREWSKRFDTFQHKSIIALQIYHIDIHFFLMCDVNQLRSSFWTLHSEHSTADQRHRILIASRFLKIHREIFEVFADRIQM